MKIDVAKATQYNGQQKPLSPEEQAMAIAGFQYAVGLDVDGKAGPKTRAVIASELSHQGPVTPAAHPTLPPWPRFDGPLTMRPRSRSEVIKIFGDPGTKRATPDPAWEKASIVELHGANAIPEIPAKLYFKCHRLAEPYIREAFRRAHIAVPGYPINEHTASYVFRHMRHNPELPLSLHSWGIAFDVSYDLNPAQYFDVDEDGPEPWTPEWNKLFPKSMPQPFVEAIESVGFRWGGRWRAAAGKRGFKDLMHFELCGPGDVAL
ncbi:MAG TPA: M15 family metallopeptidase [Acidimicrobiales bacterium]